MNATFETARQIHQIGGGRVIIGSGSLVGAASLMAVPSVLQWHQLTDRQPSLCMYVYIYIYIYMCVCVCVCVCVYVYGCMYLLHFPMYYMPIDRGPDRQGVVHRQ